jgi:hypothetical protein
LNRMRLHGPLRGVRPGSSIIPGRTFVRLQGQCGLSYNPVEHWRTKCTTEAVVCHAHVPPWACSRPPRRMSMAPTRFCVRT